MESLVIAGVGVLIALVLLLLGVPVAFSLGVTGLLGITVLRGADITQAFLVFIPYSTIASWSLVLVPLFIVMGNFAGKAGISDKAFDIAYKLIGNIRGGLAMAACLACAAFAAVTGSGAATVTTIGKVSIPEMLKRRYHPRLATGSVASAAFLGIEIPPSIPLVIYGFIAEQSIGKLFMASLFPGIITAIFFILGTHVIARIWPTLGPPSGVKVPLREKITASFGLWEVGLLFLIVIGGIYLGILTATEAATFGALTALILLLVRVRKGRREAVSEAMKDAANVSCSIFVIFLGAMFFNIFLIQAGVPTYVGNLIASSSYPSMVLIILIILFYVPLGMFLDPMSIQVVTVPIFLPIIVSLGYDPIWFGVIVVQMIELSLITPPVGLNCFIVKGISPPEVTLADVFIGTAPYFVFEVLVIVLLVIFPAIALWLPGKMFV
ncbi:MAG: TRAP transporter large permease [Deltaproteobacteria bacterium]|nr:TRAP transporter large permease [Deltaproteobacteria bacterium]